MTMEYWTHINSGRVGKAETKPSSDWLEISYETYCKEYALDHDGAMPDAAALPTPAPDAEGTG
jgi:hypothetical protein